MVRWTQDEWRVVAAEYNRQRGDALTRINKAQAIVFPPGSLRRRAIYQKQQFWELLQKAQREIKAMEEVKWEVPPSAMPAAEDHSSSLARLATHVNLPGEEPASPAPEPDTLDALVKRTVTALTKEVSAVVALAVIEEVKRVIATEVPKAIHQSAALWFSDNKSAPVGASPIVPQEIHLTVSEALPEGVKHLTLPPKERKPRITVLGLIGQQEQDVLHAWGQSIDFSFVRAGPNMGPMALDKSRTADVVINMTRFTHHTVEQFTKQIDAPLVRLNGSVSSLKKWISDWVNGKIAIAG